MSDDYHARNRQQAMNQANEELRTLYPVRRTGEVPCDGWRDYFRTVERPANGYRDPEADQRPIIEVEVDCSGCAGTGYYHSRYGYCGPCRLCNGTGLVTVRAYPKEGRRELEGVHRCCS